MGQTSEKVKRKFTSRMQARLLLVFCVIFLIAVGLMGRLVYLTQTDGDRYKKQVLSRQSYVSAVIPYKRGAILDRNGTVLARSELRYRLIFDPKYLLENEEYIEPTKEALHMHFQISEDEIATIFQERPKSQYVILRRNIGYQVRKDFQEAIKDLTDVEGIWFEEYYVRNYPYQTIASDVIGFTTADNRGYWGIEEYYNEELNGVNGREYGYYDSSLNIERNRKEAQHGNTVVSTIDVNAQRIVQKHIKEFNAEFGSKSIGVLVMDPNNGEVIAMASNEEYNLNEPRDLSAFYSEEEINSMTEEEVIETLNKIWKNDILSSGFEPGSTFKPFTVAGALEEAIITPNDTFECDGGEYIGGYYIRCSNRSGHGTITLAEALMKSCNDAMMQIANGQGRDLFYLYQTSFGFGRKTGIDLPGEESGILISQDNLNESELATSSFGQSFNTTMIQLASAYSSLVNGGNYYQPHIMKRVLNDSGATVRQQDKILVKKTVSEEVSKLIQEYMYQTVELGTAKGAQVEGYAVGGKTGTAQKYPREAKTYVVSFIGAVPAINPEIVIYVTVDEPQNVPTQADSSIATKLTSRILTEVLPALGIFPEGEIDYLLPETDDSETLEQENEEFNPDAIGPFDE